MTQGTFWGQRRIGSRPLENPYSVSKKGFGMLFDMLLFSERHSIYTPHDTR